MLLSPLEDPGLTVLPTHRVITTPLPSRGQVTARLAETFDLTDFTFTAATKTAARKQFVEALRANGRTAPTFGLAFKGDDRY